MLWACFITLFGHTLFIEASPRNNIGTGDVVLTDDPLRFPQGADPGWGDRGRPLPCGGLSCADWDEASTLVDRIKSKSAAKKGKQYIRKGARNNIIGDVALTPEEARDVLGHMDTTGSGRRWKRKVYDYGRWQSPIHYVVNSADFSTTAEYDNVIESFNHWSASTCLDVTQGQPSSGPYIQIQRANSGCWSYIGRINSASGGQPINIGNRCANNVGIPIHEIGHALGLAHEQSRYDRDNYIQIMLDNIDDSMEGNFDRVSPSSFSDHGVPYDFGSIMHYGGYGFCQDCNQRTIQTLDLSYQNVIGQRGSTSYYDRAVINLAYQCSTPSDCPSLQCTNGGVPNPRSCNSCICPEGFGGQLCDEAGANSVGCYPFDGNIEVTSTGENCLNSPNWPNDRYNNRDVCNWHLKAADGFQIDWYINPSNYFLTWYGGIDGTCAHWLEVRDSNDNTIRGHRYCGGTAPSFSGGFKTSESNEVVINFSAWYRDIYGEYSSTGFQLCYKISGDVAPTIPTSSPSTPVPATPSPTSPAPTPPPPTSPPATSAPATPAPATSSPAPTPPTSAPSTSAPATSAPATPATSSPAPTPPPTLLPATPATPAPATPAPATPAPATPAPATPAPATTPSTPAPATPPVDYCSIGLDPCVYGDCESTLDGATCHCWEGFEGDDCDADVNECLSSPCLNRGRCKNRFGTFKCRCRRRYYGPLCQYQSRN